MLIQDVEELGAELQGSALKQPGVPLPRSKLLKPALRTIARPRLPGCADTVLPFRLASGTAKNWPTKS
jgi:hypothetical protein